MYATADDGVGIAYQSFGEGSVDLDRSLRSRGGAGELGAQRTGSGGGPRPRGVEHTGSGFTFVGAGEHKLKGGQAGDGGSVRKYEAGVTPVSRRKAATKALVDS